MKTINKAYKFRIYPNKAQEEFIHKTFGCCRFVYNYILALKQELYKENKKSLSYGECCKHITAMKNTEDYKWLKEVDSDALQKELKNLNQAYQNFFKHGSGFPKFKSKKNNYKSYTATQNRTMEVRENLIKLPKLKWIKAITHRKVNGKILNATISQNPSGEYYVSLCCEEEIEELVYNENQVGIDLGISDLAILSNGFKFPNMRFIKKSEKNLAKNQRILSKMKFGSNNYKKQKIKVAKIHQKVSRQRKEYLNIITSYLVNNYGCITIEDLNSSGLMKNKKLSKAIVDVSWFEFYRQLSYKCNWYGRELTLIDRWFPSSQLCSNCGKNTGKKALHIREFVCPYCGVKHDRDINASINIDNEGKRIRSEQRTSQVA